MLFRIIRGELGRRRKLLQHASLLQNERFFRRQELRSPGSFQELVDVRGKRLLQDRSLVYHRHVKLFVSVDARSSREGCFKVKSRRKIRLLGKETLPRNKAWRRKVSVIAENVGTENQQALGKKEVPL